MFCMIQVTFTSSIKVKSVLRVGHLLHAKLCKCDNVSAISKHLDANIPEAGTLCVDTILFMIYINVEIDVWECTTLIT